MTTETLAPAPADSRRLSLRSVALVACGLALLLSFVEPNRRGMPIGQRQLSQHIPDVVIDTLGRLSTLAVLATCALAGLSILVALFVDRSPRYLLRSKPVLIAVTLMVVAVAIGALRGLLGASETRHALSHGQFVVPYIVALGLPIPNRSEWSKLMHAMRIGFTVPALYSLIIVVIGFTEPPIWFARIIPNGTSFGGVACLLWLAHARESGRLRYYGLASLCATALVISGSRGWVFALLLALPVYAFFSRGATPRLRWQDFAAGIGSAFVGFLVSLRFRSAELLIQRTAKTGTSDRRVDQARNLLDAVGESPLLGSGLGFRDPDLAREGVLRTEIARPYLVELSYLNLLAKMGLIGFGLLMAGVAMLVWRQRTAARIPRPNPTMAATLAGTIYLLASSVANPSFESVYFHFFIAVALLGALSVEKYSPTSSAASAAPETAKTTRGEPTGQ